MSLTVTTAHAYRFDWDVLGGISGTINTEFSLGAQWRMEERDSDLVAKSAINPLICPSACQGQTIEQDTEGPLFDFSGDQAIDGAQLNQRRLAAPGALASNTDDGNLNFNKYDVTQAAGKFKQDLELKWNDWTFFTRYYFFYDFANVDRELVHPNLATPASALEQQRREEQAIAGNGDLGFPTVGEPTQIDNRIFNASFGDREELNEQDFRLLDFNISGFVPIPFTDGRELQVTVGRQTINWGESTVLAINSLNTINPPDVNALFRPAFLNLDEVFLPVGAIKIGASLTENTSFEAFYQYEWAGLQLPGRGVYLSPADFDLDDRRTQPFNLGFGSIVEDIFPHDIAEEQGLPAPGDSAFGIQKIEAALLGAITDTTGAVDLLPAREPEDGGQYGLSLTWFLPEFNNGTELRFYYANYHSRLPYLSAFAGPRSCASTVRPTGRATNDGGAAGLLAINNFSNDCPDLDFPRFVSFLAANNTAGLDAGAVGNVLGMILGGTLGSGENTGSGSDGNAFRLNGIQAVNEYPEDIKLYGISFNTSFGDISVQGEVAYRPNLPMQVAPVDVAFAAINPATPQGCDPSNPNIQAGDCQGGLGSDDDGFGFGIPGLSQEFAYLPGHNQTFPDFIGPYRGLGTIQPGQYIPGFERMKVLQYNVGLTYILGPTSPVGKLIKSNQVILLFEVGATQVLDLPDLCELQFEGPFLANFTHFSPGADGSGTPSGGGTVCDRLDLGNVRDGPNGVRFNPTQQDPDGFVTDLSWGYRIVGMVRYDNVLPGISIEPTFIIGHDVDGVSPYPGGNFLDGRQNYILNIELRYRQNWSASVGYVIFRGAEEPFDQLADRDFLQAGIRYRF